jgi:hypothetical protein
MTVPVLNVAVRNVAARNVAEVVRLLSLNSHEFRYRSICVAI